MVSKIVFTLRINLINKTQIKHRKHLKHISHQRRVIQLQIPQKTQLLQVIHRNQKHIRVRSHSSSHSCLESDISLRKIVDSFSHCLIFALKAISFYFWKPFNTHTFPFFKLSIFVFITTRTSTLIRITLFALQFFHIFWKRVTKHSFLEMNTVLLLIIQYKIQFTPAIALLRLILIHTRTTLNTTTIIVVTGFASFGASYAILKFFIIVVSFWAFLTIRRYFPAFNTRFLTLNLLFLCI